MSSLPHCALAGALLCSTALVCTPALPAQGVAPKIRIVNRIDESQLVTLKGNTHPAANAKNDRGRVSPDLPMTDLILVLGRSPEQQAAFEKFVASQYDQDSPDFHHWLTPAEVGRDFGPSETDIATISRWLTGHGLSVDEVPNDRMSIRFSGTAAQVESAFHTEIHNLLVKNAVHIGNMTDPQIPAALAPVVVGVKALHNFFPRPMHRMGSQVTRDAATGKWMRVAGNQASPSTPSAVGGRPALGRAATASAIGSGSRTAAAKPQFGINVGGQYPYVEEDVAPIDFATIYNILPLWKGSTAAGVIDGTGQMIAIAGTSDIDVGQATGTETGANGINDILTFRRTFGLPTGSAANTPIRVSGSRQNQPLTVCTDTTGLLPFSSNPCGIDDLVENSLDVEWSGSVAENAQIVLVSTYPASATDDSLYDSESYIVDNVGNQSSPVYGARIMNVSYGLCELENGTAGNVEYYDLWQTAATEGIAVFVAAGDSGSASCDDGYNFAASGLTVSGLASTPYNTAVGGTDFNWCNPDTFFNTECSASPYWNTTNDANGTSVSTSGPQAGYVPETPWNESCANPLTLKWVQDAANQIYGIPSTGSQGVTNVEQACNFILDYSYNDYENGVYGLGYYYPYLESLVETVGGSGGASGCVVGNAVQNANTGAITGCTTGAKSTGATTNPDTGAAQASINLYNNGWQKPSWQTPAVNNIPGLPSDGVRDLPDVSFFASDGYVSSSAYLMCSSAAQGDTPCAYSTYSEPFYQEVGGTSVATPAMAGVMALINQKAGAAQGSPNAELYALAVQQSYSNCSAESVKTNSASCYFNDIDTGTNAMPCDAADSTLNCTASSSTFGYSDAEYGLGILTGYSAGQGYDLATGLGSLNVANLVNAWASTVGTGATTVTVAPTPSTVLMSQTVSVLVTVASSPTGGTTPTGSVTLSGGGYNSAPEPLSGGAYTFTIPAGSLSGGTDTLTASYTGDKNYAPSNGSATVTVNKLSATVTATPSPSSIQSNQTLVVTGTVTCTGSCASSPTPTGTVTVSYGTTYTSLPATLSAGSYSVTITPNSLTGPSGTDTLTVEYSGDGNYAAASTTASVDVTYFQVLTPTMTVTSASTTVDSGSPLLVTVSVAAPISTSLPYPTPTGTVTLSGGGYTSSGTATLVNGVATFNIPANTLNSAPNFPTSDTLTADYLGDADYAQVAATETLTVTQSGFSLSATTPAAVAPGSSATSTVSVTSPTDYTGTVTFTSASCVLTGYPSGVTSSTPGLPVCSLTGNGTVTMTDGSPSGTVTYTVSTSGTTTAQSLPAGSPAMLAARKNDSGWFETAGGAALAALFLFLAPFGSRKWRRTLSALLLMAAIGFAGVGCGGGGGSTPPTLATPTVTVTPTPTSIAVNQALSVAVAVTGTAGTPTGGVSISGGGYSSPSQTLSAGNATFSIPANSFTSIGSVALTASYGGDNNYNPNTGTATITVSNVPTPAGTYTFTVTGAGNPAVTPAPTTTFTVTVN
ncbi:MAG: Ig-like domain repeat protein [Terracidiphilus sp.]